MDANHLYIIIDIFYNNVLFKLKKNRRVTYEDLIKECINYFHINEGEKNLFEFTYKDEENDLNILSPEKSEILDLAKEEKDGKYYLKIFLTIKNNNPINQLNNIINELYEEEKNEKAKEDIKEGKDIEIKYYSYFTKKEKKKEKKEKEKEKEEKKKIKMLGDIKNIIKSLNKTKQLTKKDYITKGKDIFKIMEENNINKQDIIEYFYYYLFIKKKEELLLPVKKNYYIILKNIINVINIEKVHKKMNDYLKIKNDDLDFVKTEDELSKKLLSLNKNNIKKDLLMF